VRLAISNGPNGVGVFPAPNLMTETDPDSVMLCSLVVFEYRTMYKVKKKTVIPNLHEPIIKNNEQEIIETSPTFHT
jgi:hypothetical protein